MAGVFNIAKTKFLGAGIDLVNAVIKTMLVNNTYTFSAAHQFVSSVSAAELSGTGYTGGFGGSGRKALGTKTVLQDDTNNRGYFNAGAITWAAINAGTAAAAVLYKEGTSDADSVLIAFIDVGGFPIVTNGGDLVIQWATSPAGVLQIS